MTEEKKRTDNESAGSQVAPEAAVSALENLERVPEELRDRLEALLSKEKAHEAEADLMNTLYKRFVVRFDRHLGQGWGSVSAALSAHPDKLAILQKLEDAGGKPDLLMVEGNEFVFADLSEQSPSNHRNLTYRQAVEQAKAMGVELMDETQYRHLQRVMGGYLGCYDTNTWVWLKTPQNILNTGYALFGRRNPDGVFVNKTEIGTHFDFNGWRGVLRVKKV